MRSLAKASQRMLRVILTVNGGYNSFVIQFAKTMKKLFKKKKCGIGLRF